MNIFASAWFCLSLVVIFFFMAAAARAGTTPTERKHDARDEMAFAE